MSGTAVAPNIEAMSSNSQAWLLQHVDPPVEHSFGTTGHPWSPVTDMGMLLAQRLRVSLEDETRTQTGVCVTFTDPLLAGRTKQDGHVGGTTVEPGIEYNDLALPVEFKRSLSLEFPNREDPFRLLVVFQFKTTFDDTEPRVDRAYRLHAIPTLLFIAWQTASAQNKTILSQGGTQSDTEVATLTSFTRALAQLTGTKDLVTLCRTAQKSPQTWDKMTQGGSRLALPRAFLALVRAMGDVRKTMGGSGVSYTTKHPLPKNGHHEAVYRWTRALDTLLDSATTTLGTDTVRSVLDFCSRDLSACHSETSCATRNGKVVRVHAQVAYQEMLLRVRHLDSRLSHHPVLHRLPVQTLDSKTSVAKRFTSTKDILSAFLVGFQPGSAPSMVNSDAMVVFPIWCLVPLTPPDDTRTSVGNELSADQAFPVTPTTQENKTHFEPAHVAWQHTLFGHMEGALVGIPLSRKTGGRTLHILYTGGPLLLPDNRSTFIHAALHKTLTRWCFLKDVDQIDVWAMDNNSPQCTQRIYDWWTYSGFEHRHVNSHPNEQKNGPSSATTNATTAQQLQPTEKTQYCLCSMRVLPLKN